MKSKSKNQRAKIKNEELAAGVSDVRIFAL
jgi:hypothetical protein